MDKINSSVRCSKSKNNVIITFDRWFTLLGIFGCNFVRIKDGSITISKIKIIHCILVMIYCVINIGLSVLIPSPMITNMPMFRVVLIGFFYFSFYSMPFVYTISFLVNVKNLQSLLELLSILERELDFFPKYSYKFISIAFGIITLINILTGYLSSQPMIFVLADQVAMFSEMITALFCNFVCDIVNVFSVRLRDEVHVGLKNWEIDRLMRLNGILMQYCGRINCIFGVAFLVFMLCDFLLITAQVYAFLLYIGREPYLRILYEGNWTLFILIRPFLIIQGCGRATKRANEFNETLYRMIMADKNDVFSRNYKVNTHLANQKTAVFTACGWFTIDYTTSCSMIATSATYLIILLQMGGTSLGEEPEE
ncbi:uncharacterized protein LOC106668447 isoform X2 [Cimex lectularius]|uniref:Gustatory receptor n=1 Tax=Cimex lectularius TaxID=79782 RepID=A0A8I6RW23_CIMLE|nr:uncharacterized protein LOC106668447 isoform X2 [Cimex lectularius]